VQLIPGKLKYRIDSLLQRVRFVEYGQDEGDME
jgi:hypothetical protein